MSKDILSTDECLGRGRVMTELQKVFLLFAAMYFLAKGVVFLSLYLVTLRIEQKALAFKRKREKILKKRWLQNRELYRKAYEDYEKRKRQIDEDMDMD